MTNDVPGGNTFSLLGNGDGTFQTGFLTLQPCCGDYATGDFNKDGLPDLVQVNPSQSRVSFYLGLGAGSFFYDGFVNTGLPAGSGKLAVADLNRDGNADVVLNQGLGAISVILGNGDGTFRAPIVSSAPNGSLPFAIADVNGDGIPDAVLGGLNQVAVLLGKGDGTFGAAISTTVSGMVTALATGDFNGDGKADVLAVTNGTAIVLLSNGDGTLSSTSSAAIGGSPTAVALADFNQDGKLDAAIAVQGGVTVLLNSSTQTFGYIDLPTDGSTVAGAVTVTGWALGIPAVTNVAVWREPVAGETATANGLIFVSNALFLPHVRPDVAAAHPGYPNNDYGWGHSGVDE